jgi:hypothetical protein
MYLRDWAKEVPLKSETKMSIANFFIFLFVLFVPGTKKVSAEVVILFHLNLLGT